MTPTKNKAAYWDAAGPAIALAVERKYYFKKLIKLCHSLPNDEVLYLLSIEICRWLDKGDSLEDFINWVECSSAGTAEKKAIILNKLLPGTPIRLVHGMVELGALLGKYCENIGEQRDTPDWIFLKWMLSREEIISSSTMLHNGYPKGYVFHCVMHLQDTLGVICENRFNLEIFYSIYKEICYGEAAQLLQKARTLLAPAVIQLDTLNADDNLIDDHIEVEDTLPAVLAETTINDLEQDTCAKLTHRQIALLYVYQGILLDEALASKAGRENGHGSRSTGRKIMTLYHDLRGEPNNRIGVEGNLSVGNMRKAIAGVIPLLSGNARQQAERELQSLEIER
jgi:hypothetical protein